MAGDDRVTLDDLVELMADDQHGRRYEVGTDGTLAVTPPPDSEHAAIASRLMLWLAYAGWTAEQLLQAVGVRIPGPDGDGGRIPDLTVWARPQPRAVWLGAADLVLVIEIVSKGSEAIDRYAKVNEYAAAGVPQYWVVNRDTAQSVALHRLGADGRYEVTATLPLAWLLRTKPADHGIAPAA